MSIVKLRVATLIVLLTVARNGLAQTRALEMKWNELASLVVGHGVTLILTDGTAVRGEAVAVRDDAMLVDVGTDSKAYKKGSGSVPRNSIEFIDVQRTRGSWGRILGTGIGALGGLSLGGYVIAKSQNHVSLGGATGILVGVGAAGIVAGYFGGRSIDRRVTHIKIVP